MGKYISTADVTNWPGAMTQAQREARVDLAEQLIEKVCRDYFVPTPFLVYCDGNGASELVMPFRFKLISVTSITIDGEKYTGPWITKERSVVLEEDEFPTGRNNVVVEGTLGWAETPQPIKEAVKILVETLNDPTSHQRLLKGSENLGDYSYSTAGTVLTGVREVDELIAPYVNRRIGVV